MRWTYDTTIALIKQYEKHECLWNVDSKGYKDIIKKKDAWHDIGTNLDGKVEEVERKMKSLLSSYRRERRKIFELKKSGSAVSEMYEPKWFGYKHMQFLKNINRRKTIGDNIINQNSHIDIYDDEEENEEKFVNGNEKDLARSDDIEFIATKQNDDLSVALRSPKRQKILNRTDKADIAFTTMKSVAQEGQVKQRDEYSAFGEVVAHKLRKLGTEAERNVAQFKINEILFQACMGNFR